MIIIYCKMVTGENLITLCEEDELTNDELDEIEFHWPMIATTSVANDGTVSMRLKQWCPFITNEKLLIGKGDIVVSGTPKGTIAEFYQEYIERMQWRGQINNAQEPQAVTDEDPERTIH